MLAGEERASAVHAGLHFIQHQQRPVPAAQFSNLLEVPGRGQPDACLGLNRLDDERREPLRCQLLFERCQIAEWHRFRPAQHGAEALAPERIAHQRKRAAGQSVERAIGVQQAGAPGVRPRKLDGRLDALAAGGWKERFPDTAAGARA